MATTIKTLQGEILVSEVEAVILDNNFATIGKAGVTPTRVMVVGKSGIKYDLTSSIQATLAMRIYNATLNLVAGTGHVVFDPAQVK